MIPESFSVEPWRGDLSSRVWRRSVGRAPLPLGELPAMKMSTGLQGDRRQPRRGPQASGPDLGACQELRPPEEATKHHMVAHQNPLSTERIRKGKPANRPLGYHTALLLSRPFFMDHHVRLTFPEASGAMKAAWMGRVEDRRACRPRGPRPDEGEGKKRVSRCFARACSGSWQTSRLWLAHGLVRYRASGCQAVAPFGIADKAD
jgi:hypothetical protein